MSKHVNIAAADNYVDHRTALLRFYRKERGETKTEDGYRIPLTTHHDVDQLVTWWNREYIKALANSPWHRDPAQQIWEDAKSKIASDAKEAKPDAVYPDNAWFWNNALLKFAIYLQGAKTRPSSTDLLIESFQESIGDRIDDVGDIVVGVGKKVGDVVDVVGDAAGAVVDAGQSAWTGLKIAAIVGVSVAGAAIVLPPVIRAFRD